MRAGQYCNAGGTICFDAEDGSTSGIAGSISTYSTTTNPQGSTFDDKPVSSCKKGDWLTGCSGV